VPECEDHAVHNELHKKSDPENKTGNEASHDARGLEEDLNEERREYAVRSHGRQQDETENFERTGIKAP
jgi:hypothetical protein